MPVRVYELAREFDLPSKEVVAVCRQLGFDVASHSSTVEDAEADLVRRHLAGELGDEEAVEAPPAPPPPPTPVVRELSPEEQLAQARSRKIALPTRGPAKPKAEGIRLTTRRKPPTRPGAEAAPLPEAAPVAEAAPAAETAAAPPAAEAVAPVAEVAAPEAPPAAELVAEAAAPPEAPPAAEEQAEVETPAERQVRRAPRPKLVPRPKLAPRPGLAAKPRGRERPAAHPQAAPSEPPIPQPHPQALGVGAPAAKKPGVTRRPGKPRAQPAPAGEAGPPPLEETEAGRKGRRRGVTARKVEDEEAALRKRAQAFRRRERQKSREDVDGVEAGAEGAGRPAALAPERVRVGRSGRAVTSRAHARELVPKARRPVPEGIRNAVVELPITVKTLSAALGVKASDIIRKLMDHEVMATVNDALTEEQAQMLALAYEIGLKVRREQAPAEILQALESLEDPPEALRPRPPVVVFMGHVDHGKTSLMDYIRKTRVVDGEAGGITQHIGAYRVHLGERWITFLDTPGHEAFTAMRARGASVTDVAVLVVAADDGVMPQTEEAINHARAAGVPIVVALNKCDLPQANPQRVRQQLTQFDLLAEEWGGQTIMIETSAVTGQNVDKLLDSLLLEAEMRELRANPDRPALGAVIEAEQTEGFGPVATLLVQKGTLKPGNAVLAGTAYGRVRVLTDENGRRLKEAAPTVPVRVAGLSTVPTAGDRFYVLAGLAAAKRIAEDRERRLRETALAEQRKPRTLEAVFEQMVAAEVKELPLILKADVQGSLEALRKNLERIEHPEVRIHVIHAAVGGINESDVLLADVSNAIIIGFQAVPDPEARLLAQEKGVDIRLYQIIYNVTDDVKKALEGLLTPEKQERRLGECTVAQTFKISRVGTIAGCMVNDGVINRNARLRIVRDGLVVYEGAMDSLKRFKDDAREVRAGQDCGIKIHGYDDVKVGDRLEAFETVEIQRTLA